jgi:hypothetical protein
MLRLFGRASGLFPIISLVTTPIGVARLTDVVRDVRKLRILPYVRHARR